MMYTAKVKGQFTETQSVEAISPEDASAKFLANEAETLSRDSVEGMEVSDIAEVVDEGDALEPEDA